MTHLGRIGIIKITQIPVPALDAAPGILRIVQNKNRCRHTPSVAYLPAQKRQKPCGNGELRNP